MKQEWRRNALQIAREAGQLIVSSRANQPLDVQYKSKDDPVTNADQQASDFIVQRLKQLFPTHHIVSEEMPVTSGNSDYTWLVDPIDGTKEFVAGRPDWAVSIGLIYEGRPVLGVVYTPDWNECWSGGPSIGLWKDEQLLTVTSWQPNILISASDTAHLTETVCSWGHLRPMGSIALKLARVAAGDAIATWSSSPRGEWDICAGHALLLAVSADLKRRVAPFDVRYTGRWGASLGTGLVAAHSQVLPTITDWLRHEDVILTELGTHSIRRTRSKEAHIHRDESGNIIHVSGDEQLLRELVQDLTRNYDYTQTN